MDFKPRGRGRGRGITFDTVRPSGSDKTSSINEVIRKIDVLLLDGGDNVQVENIAKDAEGSMKSEEDMDFVVSAICNACFTNEAFVKIGSKLCCSLLPLNADSVKFRTCLMNFLEKEYNNRSVVSEESPRRFLNSVKFVTQLSTDMTSSCPLAANLLLVALFDYMKMLLDSNNEEQFQIVEKMLLERGEDLLNFAKSKGDEATFPNLMPVLRQKIIEDSTTKVRRVKLLHLFELAMNNFQPLNDDVRKAYQLYLK